MEIKSTGGALNTDTPLGINEKELMDVLPYATSSDVNMPSPKVRLNYVRMLYDVLGYDLSPDIALASVTEPVSELVLATAGGGKTTWAQVKAIMQKLIRPSRRHPDRKIKGDAILCLVYNKHNVPDMVSKHKQMVARLNAANIKGLDIDNSINACTMHSFCDFWRREYVAKMGLLNHTLLMDSTARSMMARAIKIACKLMNTGNPAEINENKVLELYNLSRESLRDVSDLTQTDKFSDLGLSASMLTCIFERYEASKSLSKKYDFVDILQRFYKLLQTDEKVLARVQSYYEYVIADEVQDFTPLMWEILRLMVSNGTPLTCIGDDDQSIYYFRGTDVKNLLSFSENFTDGHVYLLSKNRRCRKAILDEARAVVETNTLRFNKELLGYKDGGKIHFVPYNSTEGQIINVTQELQKLSEEELRKTVVCYRDTACSILLTELLEEHNIPFHVISGVEPFQHELYRHVLNVLDFLEMPCDRKLMLNLYKVLPCSRKDLFEVFGYSPEKDKFKTEDTKIHFSRYYYGKLVHVTGFADAMETLIDLSNRIETAPLTEIFPTVYSLLTKYFWTFKKSQNSDLELDELMESRVKRLFNVDVKYSSLFKDLQHRKAICHHNTEAGEGVAVSTFHSLKGLEFDRVYTLFMDDDIFPNYALIDNRNYSPEVTVSLKESETRLWYVAVTRAKDELIIYYKRNNPSKYVRDSFDRRAAAKAKNSVVEPELDFVEEETPLSLDQLAQVAVSQEIEECDFIDADFLTDTIAEEPMTGAAELETSAIGLETGAVELSSFGDAPDYGNIKMSSTNTYLSQLLANL